MVEADAERYAALVRMAFGGLGLDPPPSALGLTGAAVAAHLAEGGGVTTEPGEAGLLWTEKEGGLYVSRVAVHPAARGRGLAAAMLAVAEAEARRRGLPRIWLATRLALTGNRRLFARCGFVETTLHSHPGYAAPTFVDMEKPIGGEPGPAPGVSAGATC